jgi:hypothetical protein
MHMHPDGRITFDNNKENGTQRSERRLQQLLMVGVTFDKKDFH